MKQFKLQPKERPDMTLPYPYFIDEKGMVGRQDFWKGEPYQLMGFSPKKSPGNHKNQITFEAFLKNPQKAVGMYPIFSHDLKNGAEWFTYVDPIESVKEIKE